VVIGIASPGGGSVVVQNSSLETVAVVLAFAAGAILTRREHHPSGVTHSILRAPMMRQDAEPAFGRAVTGHANQEAAMTQSTSETTESTETTETVDELGPVDWIVVEFPGSRFKGEIIPALEDLVQRGIVRILDLLIMKKDDDGNLEAFELSDLDDSELGSLRSYETELAMLLSEDDVNAVAAAVEPGSTAAVLVWENSWAAPFASAVRRAGGQLVASGRIPVQALLAVIEEDDEQLAKEGV
jgi:hypothetical protein